MIYWTASGIHFLPFNFSWLFRLTFHVLHCALLQKIINWISFLLVLVASDFDRLRLVMCFKIAKSPASLWPSMQITWNDCLRHKKSKRYKKENMYVWSVLCIFSPSPLLLIFYEHITPTLFVMLPFLIRLLCEINVLLQGWSWKTNKGRNQARFMHITRCEDRENELSDGD